MFYHLYYIVCFGPIEIKGHLCGELAWDSTAVCLHSQYLFYLTSQLILVVVVLWRQEKVPREEVCD